ncbi:hypothetical protein [Dictyobacter kobayashii]|uniref:Uncharacterized protein n=1 Tax=Dictyobacter kobayashii TaxID=2014872 RepID=A0A402AI04_9CHLR|nr:hypothetical protein [Dictyobacter kobayashii]GCE18685.1 hypothetical protein KDK_24850 [Dictyobacter kobayashii]
MITPEQVKDVEQLRSTVHGLIKGTSDEYLLATYNGILRRLDERIPKIKTRAEGKSMKLESREIIRQQREAMRQKNVAPAGRPQTSSQKTA